MKLSTQDTAQRVKDIGIIPILRGDMTLNEMLALAEILCSEGIPIVEVTLNSTGALDAIVALREQFEAKMLVGAGTVRTERQLQQALSAGAQFTVSPNLDLTVIANAQRNHILHLPGVFTPTEVQMAVAAGCRMVKLFPSDAVGPAYLKALRAPLDEVEFVPTGGITVNNLAEYARAGAVAVGVGSALVSSKLASTNEFTAKARAFREAWDRTKSGYNSSQK